MWLPEAVWFTHQSGGEPILSEAPRHFRSLFVQPLILASWYLSNFFCIDRYALRMRRYSGLMSQSQKWWTECKFYLPSCDSLWYLLNTFYKLFRASLKEVSHTRRKLQTFEFLAGASWHGPRLGHSSKVGAWLPRYSP